MPYAPTKMEATGIQYKLYLNKCLTFINIHSQETTTRKRETTYRRTVSTKHNTKNNK
jgi:hypothetical protein